MNSFPLAPFFTALQVDGIRVTLDDYDRISLALESGSSWSIKRLRGTLLALLVQNPEQEDAFLRRFDSFFDSECEAELSAEDARRVLENLRYLLNHGTAKPGITSPHDDEDVFASNKLTAKSGLFRRAISKLEVWHAVILTLTLVLGVAVYMQFFKASARPEPAPQAPEDVLDVNETTPAGSTPTRLIVKGEKRSDPQLVKNRPGWQDAAAVWGIVLLAFIGYRVSRRYIDGWNLEKPPDWDRDGPRHFPLGKIGGKPAPHLSASALDNVSDSLGYFQSEAASRELDIDASIKAMAYTGGLPALVFRKRRQLRTVYILEDMFAEGLSWNPTSQELVEGLRQRGINVMSGRFRGVPSPLHFDDGSRQWLEDLEDNRRDYLLLIFSDGKGINYHRDHFVLESLSQWPMVAWIELREPRFWDESTALLMKYKIPVFPASADGLLQAMRRITTEQAPQKDYSDDFLNRRNSSAKAGANLQAYLERMLGDSLLWAQACAMIQPISLGLADGLRREFQPHLPPERIERLFRLPGTTRSVSGLRFSIPVLSTLRAGFAVRWKKRRQEAILKFLLRKIAEQEPLQKDSLAHLNWELTLERVRLEMDPDKALKRIAELYKTPLHNSIRADFQNVSLPGEGADRIDEFDLEKVPLRLKPKTTTGLEWLKQVGVNTSSELKPFARMNEIAARLRRFVRVVIVYRFNSVLARSSKAYRASIKWLLSRFQAVLLYILFSSIVLKPSSDTIEKYIELSDRAKRKVAPSSKKKAASRSNIFLNLGNFFTGGFKPPPEPPEPPSIFIGPNSVIIPQTIIDPPRLVFSNVRRYKKSHRWLTIRATNGTWLSASITPNAEWISVGLPTVDFMTAEWKIKITVDAATLPVGQQGATITYLNGDDKKEIPVDVTVVETLWQRGINWFRANKPSRLIRIYLLLLALSLIAGGIGMWLGPNWVNRIYNKPPVLQDIDIESPADNSAKGVVLKSIVSDPDGDAVTYRWETDKGSIIDQDGDSVILDTEGLALEAGQVPVEVKLMLTDARGGKSYYSTKIDLEFSEVSIASTPDVSLEGADLGDADLEGVDLRKAQLSGRYKDAILAVTTLSNKVIMEWGLVKTDQGISGVLDVPLKKGLNIFRFPSGTVNFKFLLPLPTGSHTQLYNTQIYFQQGDLKVIQIPSPSTSTSLVSEGTFIIFYIGINTVNAPPVENVDMLVDGRSIGTVNNRTLYPVPAGTHRFTAIKKGYKKWEQVINLAHSGSQISTQIRIWLEPESDSGAVASESGKGSEPVSKTQISTYLTEATRYMEKAEYRSAMSVANKGLAAYPYSMELQDLRDRISASIRILSVEGPRPARVKKEESALFPELSIFTGRSSIVVTVRVEIDAQGKVTSAKAVGTLPVSRELAPNLYDLAEETAKKWEFFPATGTTDANGVTEKLASKKTIRVKLFMVNTN